MTDLSTAPKPWEPTIKWPMLLVKVQCWLHLDVRPWLAKRWCLAMHNDTVIFTTDWKWHCRTCGQRLED